MPTVKNLSVTIRENDAYRAQLIRARASVERRSLAAFYDSVMDRYLESKEVGPWRTTFDASYQSEGGEVPTREASEAAG